MIQKIKKVKNWLRPSPEQDGFTLVEVIVTIIVLGVVISSLSGLYYLNQETQVETQHYDIAVRAARTEIEDLRNEGYDTLSAGTNINFASSLPSNFPHGATATAAITQPITGLIRIDATISYTDYGKQQTVTLSSDVGVIGIGQG